MKRPEQVIHKAVADHLRIRGAPGLVWFHVAQSNYARNRKGTAIQAAINKGLGVRKGVSDLILFHQGNFYALEIKPKGRTPTEEQYAFLACVEAAGGFSAWTAGVDKALKVLETWGLLKGTTSFPQISN